MSKKGSKRTLGLWFNTRKIEVQDVNSQHSKVCKDCGMLPVHRRLAVTDGYGRHGVFVVRCVECGVVYLKQMRIEAERAVSYLKGETSVASVRL